MLELESRELLLLEDDLQSGGITALDVLELSILLLDELERLLLDELSTLLELEDEFSKAHSPQTTNVEQMTISQIPPTLELELYPTLELELYPIELELSELSEL